MNRPNPTANPTADRVLVLGGGLAGVACAQKLGDEGIEVVQDRCLMVEHRHAR